MLQTTVRVVQRAGFLIGQSADDPCRACAHTWGEHVLSAAGEPMDGGTYTCPQDSCPCGGTWDTNHTRDRSG